MINLIQVGVALVAFMAFIGFMAATSFGLQALPAKKWRLAGPAVIMTTLVMSSADQSPCPVPKVFTK